ncbi:MAG: endolytic transglycosylase MltG [Fimbriimonadaceae bacterium]|nr:endolytic transglycosylase MltG [Fimbriimonadaceae bacterium]
MKRLRIVLVLGVVLLLVASGAFAMLSAAWKPVTPGPERYVRLARQMSLNQALIELEGQGIIRDAQSARLYAKWKRTPGIIDSGTYQLRPGMTLDQVFRSLQHPVRQSVRIPEGWWISRVAKRLEEKEVCSASEYISLAEDGEKFKDEVSFPVPSGSLEGYLFPDTYDLPPMIGAKETILRQLRAFESKVWPVLKDHQDPNKVLTKASMVELEAALDEERPMVAGVIDNRLVKGMQLQIDATVLYQLGEWKVLGPGEVRTIKGPYNTYLSRGLPPGPIGSPGLASIEGVLNPAKHNFLYYVARPNRSHFFSVTYPEHQANIRRARLEREAAEAN